MKEKIRRKELVASEQEVCLSSETRRWEEKQELQVKPGESEEVKTLTD